MSALILPRVNPILAGTTLVRSTGKKLQSALLPITRRENPVSGSEGVFFD
jgi:hypothetical protein